MSISKVNKDKKLNLLICKKGGSDKYQNGYIVAETDKAILVQFEQENKEVWIPKKMVWENDLYNKDNYGVKAKLWVSWERLTVQDISVNQIPKPLNFGVTPQLTPSQSDLLLEVKQPIKITEEQQIESENEVESKNDEFLNNLEF